MYAVIAVPFFDSPENKRTKITKKVLKALREQIKPPDIIVPVDNGSVTRSTWNWIKMSRKFPHAKSFDNPRSTSAGVNYAWYDYHQDLMTGKAVAVKFDSDIVMADDDWLQQLKAVVSVDGVGLAGPRNPKQIYNPGEWMIKNHGAWMETPFVYGAVVMRSPTAFRKIGYMRQPWGRYSWDDHWDVYRVKHVGLKVATLAVTEWKQLSKLSCVVGEEKEENLKKGERALNQMIQLLKLDIFSPFQGPIFS